MTTHLWALIQEWRDAQFFDVSQAKLAGRVGVTRSAMSQWKTGEARPRPEHLRKLASIIRVDYLRLLTAMVQDMGYLTEEEVAHHATPMMNSTIRDTTTNGIGGLSSAAPGEVPTQKRPPGASE